MCTSNVIDYVAKTVEDLKYIKENCYKAPIIDAKFYSQALQEYEKLLNKLTKEQRSNYHVYIFI